MWHIGYIAGFSKKKQYGVVVDSKRKPHYFKVSDSDPGESPLNVRDFVVFSGEGDLVTGVSHLSRDYFKSEGLLTRRVTLFGDRLEYAENFIAMRFLYDLPLFPDTFYFSQDYCTDIVRKACREVKETSKNLSEIASTYKIKLSYKTEDNMSRYSRRYYLERQSLSYADAYVRSLFQRAWENVHGFKKYDIPMHELSEVEYDQSPYGDWEEQVQKIASVEDEIRKNAIKSYDEADHLSVLLHGKLDDISWVRSNTKESNDKFAYYWGLYSKSDHWRSELIDHFYEVDDEILPEEIRLFNCRLMIQRWKYDSFKAKKPSN